MISSGQIPSKVIWFTNAEKVNGRKQGCCQCLGYSTSQFWKFHLFFCQHSRQQAFKNLWHYFLFYEYFYSPSGWALNPGTNTDRLLVLSFRGWNGFWDGFLAAAKISAEVLGSQLLINDADALYSFGRSTCNHFRVGQNSTALLGNGIGIQTQLYRVYQQTLWITLYDRQQQHGHDRVKHEDRGKQRNWGHAIESNWHFLFCISHTHH